MIKSLSHRIPNYNCFSTSTKCSFLYNPISSYRFINTTTTQSGNNTIPIIDAHHHLWDSNEFQYSWEKLDKDDHPAGDFNLIKGKYEVKEYLDDARQQHNIVKSVHVQAEYRDKEGDVGETRYLQELADSNSEGFPHAIVARANFIDPNIEEILEQHNEYQNMRGIRHMLNFSKDPRLDMSPGPHMMKNINWRKGFKNLKKYNMSFDMQIYPDQLDEAIDLATSFPDILIILNHAGLPYNYSNPEQRQKWKEGISNLAKVADNTAIKISGMVMFHHDWNKSTLEPIIMDSIDAFGIDRCMFASNFPVDKLQSAYADLFNVYLDITSKYFTVEEQQKLFHDNAARYYRIE